MRLAITADLHGTLPNMPDCDIVIVAGDVCPGPAHVNGKWRPDLSDGRSCDWLRKEFAEWASKHKHTIVVAGNHDTAIQQYGFPSLSRVTYLEDSGVTIDGLFIWGTPWVRRWDNLAFNADAEDRWKRARLIPRDIDLLVCHSPPRGIRDQINLTSEHLGCEFIETTLREKKTPRVIACGHIHEAAGLTMTRYGTLVVNAAQRVFEIEV